MSTSLPHVNYTRLPGMGPGRSSVQAPLHTFLMEIPGLFPLGYVPPLKVVNEFLKAGTANAGMSGGCQWTPFVVSEEEYAMVVAKLRDAGVTSRNTPLHFVDAPASISRRNEWGCWVFEREVGIPFEQHLALVDREEELRGKADLAAARNDARATEFHLEAVQAGMELVELIEPYLDRYRGRSGDGGW